MKELKPCPFCGSRRVGVYHTWDGTNMVLCEYCGACSTRRLIPEEVMALWNRRNTEQADEWMGDET